jgi:tetratricopeptide (TPR) repeat protein
VIAFTTTRQYRSTSKGIDQIGRELGVQYIVEGSVRRAPDRLRITVQLIKVSDQTHLWASAYNRAMDDVIGIQIDVAERVAQALTVGLFARNKLSMERAATRNAEAYEAYLRGRHYFNRRRSVDDFQKATRHFEEAIENDPEYVLAHVGLADVYTVMGLHSHIEPRQAYRAAIKHLDRAFALDPNVAEAQYSMAYARALYERDFDGADTSFQHALALNPNYVTGRYWYALLLAAMGRFDRAIEHIEGALALDPLSLVTNSNKGWILYLARRYDEAATQLMSTLDMDQSFALAHYFLGLVLVQQGRHGQAATEFASAQQASGNHPASISGLAVAQALGGAREKARVTLKKLKELTRNRYVTPYYLAVVHAALGETDRAFSLLKDACDDGSAFLTNMNHDPGLDALREDPRFRRMTVRLGLDKARAAKA